MQSLPPLSSWNLHHGRVYEGTLTLHVSGKSWVLLCWGEGWGLCPCINYWALDSMMIQYPYPLPLVPSGQTCVYFCKRHTPAESNYDIGNRELLSIKVALKEWKNWLEGALHPWMEGALHPFQVITEHKNLEFLNNAKRPIPVKPFWSSSLLGSI